MSTTPAAPAPGRQGSARGGALGGSAASRSYNVVSIWEQTAALNMEQLQVVDLLSQACSARLYPSHVQDDQQYETPAPGTSHSPEGGQSEHYVGTLEDAVLHNTNQFHKWHAELESACASEQEEKYKRYADLLHSHLQTSEQILGKVDATLDVFDSLLEQHRDVEHRSKALYSSCEQLVKEKDQLVEFADAVRAKLKFFDEFEAVQSQFQAAQASPQLDTNQFMALLRKLDDCKSYVATNPQYADSGAYAAKFRQLHARALGALRNKVQQVLKHAAGQVQAAVNEAAATNPPLAAVAAAQTPVALEVDGDTLAPQKARMGLSSMMGAMGKMLGAARGSQPSLNSSGTGSMLAEGAEVPLLYVRFRAAAEPQLKGLFKEVEERAQRSEYRRLLEECQLLYSQTRIQLVSPFVQQRILERGSGIPLPAFTRNGCEHLMRVCQLESQLFEQFFPASKETTDQMGPLMEPLCMVLYDVLRPLVVQIQEIDELCELVDVLKHEVLGDQLSRRGSSAEALKPILGRTLADVQGRLIYRCQAFIKDEVSSYVPSTDDCDYPAKLEAAAAAARAASKEVPSEETQAGTSTEGANGGKAGNSDVNNPKAPDQQIPLYPPLRATLLCLSKMYRAVDSSTFGGLAYEAVSACTISIHQASRNVARKSTPLDAQLFMIRHLLLLREHIAPFDVDFRVTDFDLDFTHMRDHMRRLMGAEMSTLFSLGPQNAVVKMLGTSGPRVLYHQNDSKKDLEKQLKAACESFIMAVTKVAVEPMLSFITKVTAVKVTQGPKVANAQPLSEQAFASPAKVIEMVQRVNQALSVQLPTTVDKMRLYLPSPSTHTILFKPVKANIAEAHHQIEILLKAEYSAEDIAKVPLQKEEEVTALLNALC